jgi:hypothetical protein
VMVENERSNVENNQVVIESNVENNEVVIEINIEDNEVVVVGTILCPTNPSGETIDKKGKTIVY